MSNATITVANWAEVEKIIEEKFEKFFSRFNDRVKNQDSDNKLLTRKETAKYLRISLPTLNELTKSGAIPAYRIGGKVLYEKSKLIPSLNPITA